MQDRNSGTNVTSGGVLEVGAIGRLGEHNYGSPEGWVLRRPAPPRPAPPRSAPPRPAPPRPALLRPSSFSITRTWRVMYETTFMYA